MCGCYIISDNFAVNIDHAYETFSYYDKNNNTVVSISQAQEMGFLIPEYGSKKYFDLFKSLNITFKSIYLPHGFEKTHPTNSCYIFSFNVLDILDEVIIEKITIKETHIYVSINNFSSALNSGCRFASNKVESNLYYTNGFTFIDIKNAKKILDFILEDIKTNHVD